jgi:hypothetical protein
MKNLIVVVISTLLFSCGNNENKPYKYSNEISIPKVAVYDAEWRNLQNEELVKIGQVITANKIKGCGTMYLKQDGDQYLIACYSDLSHQWSYYEIEFVDGISQLTPPRKTSKQYITTPKL